jgi:hypothetical protein
MALGDRGDGVVHEEGVGISPVDPGDALASSYIGANGKVGKVR